MPIRTVREMSMKRLALWVGACVLVALIAVAAVGTFVLARQFDSDSKKRDADRTAQLRAGCDRGNDFRAAVADQAKGLRAADLYIASQLRAAAAHPPVGTPQAAIDTAIRQAKHLEVLAAAIKEPKPQDCDALYGPGPTTQTGT